MFKVSQVLLRSTKPTNRLSGLIRFTGFSSSPTIAEAKPVGIQFESDEEHAPKTRNVTQPVVRGISHKNMVAAAFASLSSDDGKSEIKTPFTDEKITKASTVSELLSISDGNGVSRRHALKVLSVLAEWSTSGKTKLSDFDTDPRFIRLCKILTKGAVTRNRNFANSKSEDLTTILSVTADDEAAKLVASITLSQMVKVMSTLSQKKRRSTLLLRSLAYNITASAEKLDLKQSADLLFSMSTLNFPDDNLLVKITEDVCAGLGHPFTKSAVIGSIITSVGLLKYKNTEILDVLSEWIVQNNQMCRPQDIFSLFMTLAVLNYLPSNHEQLFKVLIPQLTPSEAGKPLVWLEIVWSLVLLNQANQAAIESVLSDSFIQKLEESGNTNPAVKLKLLNIDGAAQYLIKGYNGPRLSQNSSVKQLNINRTKEKADMVDVVVDSLKSLIPSENCLNCNVNTGFGFFIDAECVFGKKMNALPVNQAKEGQKVAIMVLDYHDMCRGKVDPSGVNVLTRKLLEAQGYKILLVPYTEFNPRDKVVIRVQYLEAKLRETVESKQK